MINNTKKKQIILLIFGFFILFLIEILLGVNLGNKSKAADDPFVGFQKIYKLFGKTTDSTGKAIYLTNKNKRTFFNTVSFPSKKDPNTVRIFCFGGSSTYGRPYDDRSAFSTWLKEALGVVDPSKKYEVINVGGISYASYRIKNLVNEMLEYEPDIFIFYTGHNEFLEERTYKDIKYRPFYINKVQVLLNKLNLYRFIKGAIVDLKNDYLKKEAPQKTILAGEVNAILDKQGALELYQVDEEQRDYTVKHFQYNLESIISLSVNNDVSVFLLNIPSNIKDFSPFKSVHDKKIKDEDLNLWDKAYQKAQRSLAVSKFSEAEKYIMDAIDISPDYAENYFLLGKINEGLGKYKEAKEAYTQAKDKDSCALRSLTAINNIIYNIAKKYDIHFIDVIKKFEGLSLNSILGSNLFIDHCHPTIEGHQIIAKEIVKKLLKSGLISKTGTVDFNDIDKRFESVKNNFDDYYFGIGEANIGRVLNWAQQYEETIIRLNKSKVMFPDNAQIFSFLGNAYKGVKKFDLAIPEYKRAVELAPYLIDVKRKLGEIYYIKGMYEESQGHLYDALEFYPDDKNIKLLLKMGLYNQGVSLIEKGTYEKSIIKFKKALLLDPDFKEGKYNLSMSYVYFGLQLSEGGEHKKALDVLKKSLKVLPNLYFAHNALGAVYDNLGKMEKAIESFSDAVKYGVSNEEKADAHINLGLAYNKMKDFYKAIIEFNSAADMDPQNIEILNTVGVEYFKLNNFDKAISFFDKITKIAPDDYRAYYNIGISYYKKGNLSLAISFYKQSLKINPNNKDAIYNLGIANKALAGIVNHPF